MTEKDPDNNDAPAGAERLFEALRSAASDANTRETLRELGDRARGVVEDLARNARSRAAAAEARASAEAENARREREAARGEGAGATQGAFVPPELSRRIEELRGCVSEVADTLEATVERLETIECQLGDPAEHVDAKLARGLEHCEQVLRGIEYRVDSVASRPTSDAPELEPASSRACVLVVAAASALRAGLCVALEKQGLRCLAATDLVAARRQAVLVNVDAALLVTDGDPTSAAELFDDWKDGEEHGSLPPALVIVDEAAAPAGFQQASAYGFPVSSMRHGAAAMAAGLMRIARSTGAAPSPNHPEEQ